MEEVNTPTSLQFKLRMKKKKKLGCSSFLEVIFLDGVGPPLPNSNIPPRTFERPHCKGEPYWFSS